MKQLTDGCKCKTGCTGRCGCRRNNHDCGPGCRCISCTNNKDKHQAVLDTHTHELIEQEQQTQDSDNDGEDDNEYIDDYYDSEDNMDYYELLEAEVDTIMAGIFT